MEVSNSSSVLPLNECRTLTTHLIINRLHIFLTGIAISALFYYRATTATTFSPATPYVIVCMSELMLTLIWIIRRPAQWRPIKRTAFPERLPEDDKLPPIDVFIMTADPCKEPAIGVMNTLLSAMALDYPPDKLAVYLSDDGGSYVTLHAIREAWSFAKYWLPFCRQFDLKTRCPRVYFESQEEEGDFGPEYVEIKKRYDEFKEILEKISVNASNSLSRDHPPTVEVMSQQEMPFLIYVAREKRPSHPHHFKGGALNVLVNFLCTDAFALRHGNPYWSRTFFFLNSRCYKTWLRVSAMISNAPYFLVLDCDHYCNDPTSARQAMCFYFDPKISPKLAWVQFPQKFHDTSDYDIYGGRLNAIWREGLGVDGIRGPSIMGCNFYMSRVAIYGTDKIQKDVDLNQLKNTYGSSNEFIKSIYEGYKSNVSRDRKVGDALQKEMELLASCAYDQDTEWGKEVGYAYFSVVEDTITAINLHCKGWISVYLDPARPCFLGSSTTSLNDTLVQQTRWAFGLMQIGLSKYCPLLYGISKMPFSQCMNYTAHCMGRTLYVVPFYGLGLIPQISMLYGISLYPKVTDPIFIVFTFIFISSLLKHAHEVLSYGGDSLREVLYEQRIWMMKATTCSLYASLNAILDRIGLHEADFSLTNKAIDEEKARLYENGVYDFSVSPLLLAPCYIMYILNLVSFIHGIASIIRSHNANEMFVQAFLSFFAIVVNYHMLEGMFLRKDKGRIPSSVTLISAAISAMILYFGFLILLF